MTGIGISVSALHHETGRLVARNGRLPTGNRGHTGTLAKVDLAACRRFLMALFPLLAVALCHSSASAQERVTILPLKEFINPISASEAARIIAQREWAMANCPKHFTANFWLSPLGLAYVGTLRTMDPAGFKKSEADNSADLGAALKDWQTDTPEEASKKKYDFCVQIWTTHLVVEDNASKAYWAAGWQPRR